MRNRFPTTSRRNNPQIFIKFFSPSISSITLDPCFIVRSNPPGSLVSKSIKMPRNVFFPWLSSKFETEYIYIYYLGILNRINLSANLPQISGATGDQNRIARVDTTFNRLFKTPFFSLLTSSRVHHPFFRNSPLPTDYYLNNRLSISCNSLFTTLLSFSSSFFFAFQPFVSSCLFNLK